MIIEQVTMRKQVPSKNNLYIYRLIDNQYIVRKFVWLGKEDTEWDECDEVQKAEFEAHNAAVQAELEKDLNKDVEQTKNE
jgi:hypothetical protein